MYRQLNFDPRIRELPQVTFPVGYSIALFRGSSPMPGIARVSPYIFHANYVIGETNKRILLRLFLGQKRLRNLGFGNNLYLTSCYTIKWGKTLLKKIMR